MNKQYLPRGPTPMMRERQLAEYCLRQLLQSPEIQHDRALFLRYMEQITNEILGISKEKARKEQEAASRKLAALQKQQICQTISDDMRMASSTSLDKLRNLRESIRDSTAGGALHEATSSQYVQQMHPHSYATSFHNVESIQPYFADQQFQQHQASFHPDFRQAQQRERGNLILPQSDYSLPQPPLSQQPQTQLSTPPSQEYEHKFFVAENNAHHQLHITGGQMEQSNLAVQLSSPPKSTTLASISQPAVESTSNNSEYLYTSSGKQWLQCSQSTQLKEPARSFKSTGNPSTTSGIAANPTGASGRIANTASVSGAKSFNSNPPSSRYVSENTSMPPSKTTVAGVSAHNVKASSNTLSLSQTTMQQQQQQHVPTSLNASSTEPSPQIQLSNQGGNPADVISSSQRRHFSIGEEDWNEEGSAFTPSRKPNIKASPARRPSTDSSPGKLIDVQCVSAQSPTLVKQPTVSLERPLSADKVRSGNSATILATTTVPTSNAKDAVVYTGNNSSTNGATRNARAVSNASSDAPGSRSASVANAVATAAAVSSNNARSSPSVPVLPPKLPVVQYSGKEPVGTTKTVENKIETSFDDLSDLEDIDGDEGDGTSRKEIVVPMASERVQPPLSAVMMASVIHNNHQMPSSANKGSTLEESQSNLHAVPLGTTAINIEGRSQEKANITANGNENGNVEEDKDVDLSWGKLKKMQNNSLEKKNSNEINNNSREAAILSSFQPCSGRTLTGEYSSISKEEERIVAAEYTRLQREMNALRHKISGSRLPAMLPPTENIAFYLPPLYTNKTTTPLYYAAFPNSNKTQSTTSQYLHDQNQNHKSHSSNINNSGNKKPEVVNGDPLRESIDLSGLSLQRIRDLAGYH